MGRRGGDRSRGRARRAGGRPGVPLAVQHPGPRATPLRRLRGCAHNDAGPRRSWRGAGRDHTSALAPARRTAADGLLRVDRGPGHARLCDLPVQYRCTVETGGRDGSGLSGDRRRHRYLAEQRGRPGGPGTAGCPAAGRPWLPGRLPRPGLIARRGPIAGRRPPVLKQAPAPRAGACCCWVRVPWHRTGSQRRLIDQPVPQPARCSARQIRPMSSRLSGARAALVAVLVTRRMKATKKMMAAITASIGRLLPGGLDTCWLVWRRSECQLTRMTLTCLAATRPALLAGLGHGAVDLRVDPDVVERAREDRDRDGPAVGAALTRTAVVTTLPGGDGANDQPHHKDNRSDTHCYLRSGAPDRWRSWLPP